MCLLVYRHPGTGQHRTRTSELLHRYSSSRDVMAANPVKGVDSQATASQSHEWTLALGGCGETLIFLLISG